MEAYNGLFSGPQIDSALKAILESGQQISSTIKTVSEKERVWDAKQDALIGQPGQVAGFDAAGMAKAVPGWSNPNLLLNWDLRNPVNRSNFQTVNTNGHTNLMFDRWWQFGNSLQGTIELTQNGITLTNGTNSNTRISQWLGQRMCPNLAGQTVTFSALIANNVGTLYCYYGYNTTSIKWVLIGAFKDDAGIASATFTVPSDLDGDLCVMMQTHPNAGDTTTISAVKLELGDRQTLAHQNDNGEWEIIEPPDYDLQYALCSLYSPSTGEWEGYQHSNPNLLDNWYFAGPINQRGQTKYTGAGYTIDRWKHTNQYGVTDVNDGYISLSSSNASQSVWLQQEIENPALYYGKTMTASALLKNGALITCTGTIPIAPVTSNTGFHSDLTLGCDIYVVKRASGTAVFQLSCREGLGVSSADYVAAKLELGAGQTLAHKDADGSWVLNDPPPNMALELAKCQRHQLALSGDLVRATIIGANTIFFNVPTPMTMRKNPSIGIDAFKVREIIGGADQSGFTFSVSSYKSNSVMIQAAKTAHGLSDAALSAGTLSLLDANI